MFPFRLHHVASLLIVALTVAFVVRLAPRQEGSRCRVVPEKVAAPAEIELGGTVRVTLTVGAECPPEPSPIDVVLLVDQSNSMADRNKLVNAKAAARAFLDAMNLAESRVALVAFNQDAGLRSRLTHNRREIEAAIDSLTAGGQTNISAGIELARQELQRDPRDCPRAMIVLTDGYNTVSGAEPVPSAAQRAKDDGVTVVTVCAGGQCDPDLRIAASDPSLYFDVPDTTRLAQLYGDLAGLLQSNAIARLLITDHIPSNMRYVPDSAHPTPAAIGADFLRWEFAGLPNEPITYDLEPLVEGRHPTNVVTRGEFTDRRGLAGETEFPIPLVTVRAAPCAPRPLEIFFLLDDSNCLVGAWLSGMPTLEATKLGMAQMLERIGLGRHQAAVIGFGDRAIVFQPLTSDRDAVLRAVDQISFRDNSARLDLAFVETAGELASPRHRDSSQAVTVIVTDGPMTPAIDLAVARGEALRRAGVKHYAIAIGDSLLAQQAALRSIAEPGGFRAMPYNGDVLSAFDEFATLFEDLTLTCPKPTPSPRPYATPAGVAGQTLHLPSLRR